MTDKEVINTIKSSSLWGTLTTREKLEALDYALNEIFKRKEDGACPSRGIGEEPWEHLR